MDVREFVGAMGRVGLVVDRSTAAQVVAYYDRKGERGRFGDGEIHYMDLVDEISKKVAHFMSTAPAIKQVDPSQPVTVARPERVRALLDSVRSAARDASTKATFGRGRGQQRLGPRDLLHGTLLRVDRDGKGALDERGLKRALRDLRAALPEDGCRQLVCWYGVDGTGSLPRRAGVLRDSGASARPTGGNSPRGRSGGKVAATPRGASRTFRGQRRGDAAGDRGRIVGRDRPKLASADVRGAEPLDRSSFA